MVRLCQFSFFGILIVLITLIFCAGCLDHGGENPRMLHSRFDYELQIETSEPITNVTLYLPLPVKNGIPVVGDRIIDENYFQHHNVTATLTQSPPGLDLSGAYDIPNSSPWFVMVSIPSLQPGAGYSVRIDDTRNLDSPLSFANTLYPIGNESILLPKLSITLQPPVKLELLQKRGGDNWIEYQQWDTGQVIPIYADYSGSPSARVKIHVRFEGANQWVEGGDAWICNSYRDEFIWDNTGESHRWYKVQGTFGAGCPPIYPNLDHPFWKRVMSGTSST